MELQHHGIKGMRWGVRRYRNDDGSLTAAGKRRYSEDGSGNYKRVKSEHRIRLEDKYMSKGMSSETAEMAASRRIKTEKVIAAVAGMTVAAAAAYFITKEVKDKADFIIRSGSQMQVITNNPNKTFTKPFYAAVDKSDKIRYKGQLGAWHYGYNNVHKAIVKPTDNIKVVSRDKAAKVFANLFENDSNFREAFIRSNEGFKGRGSEEREKAVNAVKRTMDRKTLLKDGYDAFNLGLVNHDRDGSYISKKFYKKLEEMGYGAVVDINDQKFSGYNAKKPVIVFKAKWTAPPKTRVYTDEINSALDKAMDMNIRNDKIKRYGKIGAKYAATAGLVSTSYSMMRTSYINRYRQEHPNTKLSDEQIYKILVTKE